MKLLDSYQTLINCQDKIKQNGITIFTNFFKDKNWLEDNIVYYEVYGSCLLLLKTEGDFFRLYFFSSDEDDIQKAISQIDIKNKTVLLEIFIKDGVGKSIVYDRFNYYGRILRLRKTLSEKDFNNTEPVFAKVNDVEYITEMQCKFFNKYIDEHLNHGIISNLIANKNILLINHNKHIVGFAIYERKGVSIHLRYIVAEKTAGIKGIGSQLLHSIYCSYPKVKFITVWCREDNINALEFYRRNGFIPDGLTDCFYKSS